MRRLSASLRRRRGESTPRDPDPAFCLGSLQGLTPKRRGAKPAEPNPLSPEVRQLEAKVARLEKELATAHTILEVQGKVAGLPGFGLNDGNDC